MASPHDDKTLQDGTKLTQFYTELFIQTAYPFARRPLYYVKQTEKRATYAKLQAKHSCEKTVPG